MERPAGMSWTTFVGWYKNNKEEGVNVREAWKKYKEDNGIKSIGKTNNNRIKKTSTERRKKKGIRQLRDSNGDIIIDLVIKERKIGEDKKAQIKKVLIEREWNNLRDIIKDNMREYQIGSICIVVDRPELLSIRIIGTNEDEDIKKLKKKIVRISKEGIESVIDDRKKFYIT